MLPKYVRIGEYTKELIKLMVQSGQYHVLLGIYRVTRLVDSNLLLTSNQKFRFGLARSGQARPIRTLSFGVNGRFESRRCVTL